MNWIYTYCSKEKKNHWNALDLLSSRFLLQTHKPDKHTDTYTVCDKIVPLLDFIQSVYITICYWKLWENCLTDFYPILHKHNCRLHLKLYKLLLQQYHVFHVRFPWANCGAVSRSSEFPWNESWEGRGSGLVDRGGVHPLSFFSCWSFKLFQLYYPKATLVFT